MPGSKWGEELPALFRAVDAVAGSKRPALALLVGGDDTARAALVDHLGRDRPLLVLAGTGGLADEIASGKPRTDTPAPTPAARTTSTPLASTVPTATPLAPRATASAPAASAEPAPLAPTAPTATPLAPRVTASTPAASAEPAPLARTAPAASASTAPTPAAPAPPAGEIERAAAGVAAAAAEVVALETGAATAAPAETGADDPHDDLAVLVRSGQVAVVHLDEGADKVATVVRRVLGNRPGAKLHADVPPPAVWPRLRFRAPEPHPVIDPGYVLDYPLLADAIHEANQVVAPALHECEVAALKSRERARLLLVLAIAAGFGTTVSAALQLWLRDQPWPGVLLAVSGAAAAVLAVVARGGEDPEAGVRAERLRALYFDHLAAPPAAHDAERDERSRELATAVARLRHESVSRS
ncbi:hypothetical protein AB0425_33660 [Actinosynnema sp. NPDC051121]